MIGERNWSLDLIRAWAVTQVVAVHYFLNSGLLQEPLTGPAMAACVVVRAAMMTCVPLFLMLSGYLCVRQRWSPGYYRRIVRILAVYLLASAACLLYKALFLDGSRNPLIWCREMLNFNAAPYSWYIEMYLGLFLLIPFVNAAWQNVGQKGQLALTASLAAMTILPTLTNLSRYTSIQVQLLPGWWERFYPLAYYCLGAWLREHPLRWRRSACLLLSVLPALAGGALHVRQAAGGPLAYLDITYWHGLLTAIAAVLVFSALLQCRGDRCPGLLRRAVTGLSELSLTIYLVSWIPDQLYAAWLAQSAPGVEARLALGFLLVPASLACSALLAWLLRWPERWLLGAAKRLQKNEKICG